MARWLSRTSLQPGVLIASMLSLAMRVGGMAAAFGLGVLLARYWGPVDYGTYGLVVSISALALNVCLLGTPQLAVRQFSIFSASGRWCEIRRLSRSFQLASLAASMLLVGLALLGVHTRISLLGAPPLYWLLGSLLTLFMAQTALLSSGLRGVGKMNHGQFMDIVGRPLSVLIGCSALLVLTHELSLAAALTIQLIAAVVSTGLCQLWFHRATGGTDANASGGSEAAAGHWLHAALPLGAIDILRQLDGTYALILLGWMVAGEELGIFRVALACGSLIAMPISIIHIVLAPDISRLQHNGDKLALQHVLDRVSVAMTLVAACATVMLALLGRPLIVLAFGENYAGAWLPLLWMSVAQLGFSLFGMGPILLAMSGQERSLTKIYLVAVGSGIATAWLMIPILGGIGAALAQLVSLTTIGALSDFIALRELGLRTSRIRWPWPCKVPPESA